MSVINDMLRDLDQRQGAQPVAPFGGIAVVMPQREWPWRAVSVILIVSALIIGAYTLVSARLKHVEAIARIKSEPIKPVLAAPSIIKSESIKQKIQNPESRNTESQELAVAKPVSPVTSKVIAPEKLPNTEVVATAISPVSATPVTKPQLVKQPSQTPEAMAEESYRLAMAALRQHARSDAERELNSALSLSPNHLAAIAALARLYLEDARFDAAQQLLSPALAANVEALELRQLLARTQLSLGRAQEAQELLAARQPDLSAHTDYYAMLAALEQQLGRHAAAAQHYGELLNVDNSIAPWWLGLALALDNQQQSRDAVAAYRRALALNNLPSAARAFAQQRLSVLEGHS